MDVIHFLLKFYIQGSGEGEDDSHLYEEIRRMSNALEACKSPVSEDHYWNDLYWNNSCLPSHVCKNDSQMSSSPQICPIVSSGDPSQLDEYVYWNDPLLPPVNLDIKKKALKTLLPKAKTDSISRLWNNNSSSEDESPADSVAIDCKRKNALIAKTRYASKSSRLPTRSSNQRSKYYAAVSNIGPKSLHKVSSLSRCFSTPLLSPLPGEEEQFPNECTVKDEHQSMSASYGSLLSIIKTDSKMLDTKQCYYNASALAVCEEPSHFTTLAKKSNSLSRVPCSGIASNCTLLSAEGTEESQKIKSEGNCCIGEHTRENSSLSDCPMPTASGNGKPVHACPRYYNTSAIEVLRQLNNIVILSEPQYALPNVEEKCVDENRVSNGYYNISATEILQQHSVDDSSDPYYALPIAAEEGKCVDENTVATEYYNGSATEVTEVLQQHDVMTLSEPDYALPNTTKEEESANEKRTSVGYYNATQLLLQNNNERLLEPDYDLPNTKGEGKYVDVNRASNDYYNASATEVLRKHNAKSLSEPDYALPHTTEEAKCVDEHRAFTYYYNASATEVLTKHNVESVTEPDYALPIASEEGKCVEDAICTDYYNRSATEVGSQHDVVILSEPDYDFPITSEEGKSIDENTVRTNYYNGFATEVPQQQKVNILSEPDYDLPITCISNNEYYNLSAIEAVGQCDDFSDNNLKCPVVAPENSILEHTYDNWDWGEVSMLMDKAKSVRKDIPEPEKSCNNEAHALHYYNLRDRACAITKGASPSQCDVTTLVHITPAYGGSPKFGPKKPMPNIRRCVKNNCNSEVQSQSTGQMKDELESGQSPVEEKLFLPRSSAMKKSSSYPQPTSHKLKGNPSHVIYTLSKQKLKCLNNSFLETKPISGSPKKTESPCHVPNTSCNPQHKKSTSLILDDTSSEQNIEREREKPTLSNPPKCSSDHSSKCKEKSFQKDSSPQLTEVRQNPDNKTKQENITISFFKKKNLLDISSELKETNKRKENHSIPHLLKSQLTRVFSSPLASTDNPTPPSKVKNSPSPQHKSWKSDSQSPQNKSWTNTPSPNNSPTQSPMLHKKPLLPRSSS